MQIMKSGFQSANCFSSSRTGIHALTQPQQINHQIQHIEVQRVDELQHKRNWGDKTSEVTATSSVTVTDESSLEEHQQCGKRSRGNTYRPPREVKQTVTSVMGSLVGGLYHQTVSAVQIRRQLSSGQLDQFMSNGDDKMDEDPVHSRERAMSF